MFNFSSYKTLYVNVFASKQEHSQSPQHCRLENTSCRLKIKLSENCFSNFADVIRLRREHRIVGNLIGCPPKTPHQQVDCGLPLVLSPEEVSVLVGQGVAQTVVYSNKRQSSSVSRQV